MVDEVVMGAFLECVKRTKEGDAHAIAQELAGVELGVIQESLDGLQATRRRWEAMGSDVLQMPLEFPLEEGTTAPHG
jgi:hypothetical protein